MDTKRKNILSGTLKKNWTQNWTQQDTKLDTT